MNDSLLNAVNEELPGILSRSRRFKYVNWVAYLTDAKLEGGGLYAW
jgi:hypothetical protein